jgi:GNAT superfamily N-acetyltransferase
VPGSNESDCERWEEFVSKHDSTDAMPDAFFIAKHGQEYVGLSYLSPRQSDPNLDEQGIIQQSLTGVRAEYRRQRIALALKVKTISYARDHGFRRIFTNSGNPAMKALNKKLGFQSGPWLVFRKELDRLTDA